MRRQLRAGHDGEGIAQVALARIGIQPRLRGRERERCFRAFLHNHWVGMAVFAGIAADFAMRATAVAA